MFRAYQAHHQEVQPYVYKKLVLIILFRWLSVVLFGLHIWLYLMMMGLDMPETCRGWRNILRIGCASSWFFFPTIISRCTVSQTRSFMTFCPLIVVPRQQAWARQTYCYERHGSSCPVFNPPFVFIWTPSVTLDLVLRSQLTISQSGHRLWRTACGLQAAALLGNTLSKNRSTATLISITTYNTGRQWDAWAVARPKFDSGSVNDFFFDTTTGPVLTDSPASCQTHTNISFPGVK